MSAQTRYLVTTGVVLALAATLIGACSSSDLFVGDDAREPLDGASSDTSLLPDGIPPVPQPDAAKDTGVDAPDDAPCPTLSPPGPGFCDGGPYAPKYDAKACIVGFACTPVLCTEAGGTCVGLAPGSCPTNHIGDAAKYSCGGGIGSACCLP